MEKGRSELAFVHYQRVGSCGPRQGARHLLGPVAVLVLCLVLLVLKSEEQ